MVQQYQFPGPPTFPPEGKLDQAWYRWFTQLAATVNQVLGAITGQITSINGSLTGIAADQLAENSSAVTVVATGFARTIPASVALDVLTPAGTIASGSLTFPPGPPDGTQLRCFSTATITALTVAAGAGDTLAGTPVTTLAANTGVLFWYRSATKIWYRLS